MREIQFIFIFLLVVFTIFSCAKYNDSFDEIPLTAWEKEWRYYNGGHSSNKYSKISQVNKSNVQKLEVAWEYTMPSTESFSDIKCNPLTIDGVLYGITASKNMVALDARTGQEIWYLDFKKYDSIGRQHSARGMLYWEKENDKRLFYVYAEELYAINAQNGKLIEGFGSNGRIEFAIGIEAASDRKVRLTTPGVIYKDLIITGSFVSEQLPSAPGDIRAFNAINGELEWIFHTIPHPSEYGYDTWPENAYKELGGANSWAGMSLDDKRGIVYIPTGSPTYDFYGANRTGQNLFANSLVALNAETGERIWHYQTVHHDLWDRDLPSPPNLVTVTHGGKEIDAVAQVTKQGFLFLFNRDTGEPLFEVEEVPVPKSVMPGEESWPTQPIPVKPPPFTRQRLTKDQISDVFPESYEYVNRELSKYGNDLYSPPDTVGVLLHPDVSGGANWGGAAIDEKSATLVVNANDVTGFIKLVNRERELATMKMEGEGLYQAYCSSCHGKSRQGAHYIPPLIGIGERFTREDIVRRIQDGAGNMPAMDYVQDDDKEAIAAFLRDEKFEPDQGAKGKSDRKFMLKYTSEGYENLEDEKGYPAGKPPWATLTAFNLNTGEIKWQKILGEDRELSKQGISKTGVDNVGGPMITAGGLVFIAATIDNMFRAYDINNGEILWEYELPGQGMAVPSTYLLDGTQYIVIPVTPTDPKEADFVGKYMAFKLP